MKAILLAGGLGTRMREETEFRPKPMVEIGGRPILWHIMKQLGSHGISDFIIATGYKSEAIKQYFLDYDARNNDFTITLGSKNSVILHGEHDESNWTVTLADTGLSTSTGGRVAAVGKFLDEEPFLVLYGDGLSNVDITALIDYHRSSKRVATVTVAQPSSRFGIVEISKSGTVTTFSEKPKLEGWVNTGYFVFEPSVLSYIGPNDPLETVPLERLAREDQLSAFKHEGFWQPMDTFKEAELLNKFWEQGVAPWKTW